MGFDEKIREIYKRALVCEWGSVWKDLKGVINGYPKKYRALLALRASVIKWENVDESQWPVVDPRDQHCGACVLWSPGCGKCAVRHVCSKRFSLTAKEIHAALLSVYMWEHWKVEAENAVS